MPTYEYHCDCGHMATVIRSYDDAGSPVVCEFCNKDMARVWNAPSIHFKGGGWGGQG